MPYEYMSTPINDSATLVGAAKADITSAAMKAVAFDAATGNVVLATAGAMAMGIALPTTEDAVKTGQDVHFQIKDIGLWTAGGSFAKGAELAVGDGGKAVAATAGKAIVAIALDSAAADGDIVHVQITKSGYKA